MQKFNIVDPVTGKEVGFFKLRLFSLDLCQTNLTLLLFITFTFYHRVLKSIVFILMGNAVDRRHYHYIVSFDVA